MIKTPGRRAWLPAVALALVACGSRSSLGVPEASQGDGGTGGTAGTGGGGAGTTLSTGGAGGATTSATTTGTPIPLCTTETTTAMVFGGIAWHIALDDTHLYGAGAFVVARVPLPPGTVAPASKEILANGAGPITLALDETQVYFQSGSDLVRQPKSGGAPTVLWSLGSSPEIAVDATHVYWVELQSAWRIGKDGTGAEMIATAPVQASNPTGVTIDATHFYWVTLEGVALRAPKSGGPGEQIAAVDGVLQDIAVDGDEVFFSRFDGPTAGIYRTTTAGGPPELLAGEPTGTTGVALDATHVYYAQNTSGSPAIKRVPRAGGPAETVRELEDSAVDIVLRDGCVHATDGYRIITFSP